MNQKLRCLFLCLLIASFAFGQSFNNEWIDYNKTYYKFKVFGFGTDAAGSPIPKGIVRIPQSTLAAAGLGAVNAQHLQLWRDGQQIPIYTSVATGTLGTNDYIEFWGEINNGKLDQQLYRNADFQLSDKWSLQTDTAAYFLTVNTTGSNKRLIPTANNVANTTLAVTDFFIHTVGRYFRSGEISNGFYASFGQNLYSSSYDRGEGWVSRMVRPVACGSSTSLPQNFSDLHPYSTGLMTFKINAVGNSQNSRVVKVNLNNDSLMIFQMDYNNYSKEEVTIPVSLISSGNANFTIINQSPSACDDMRVSLIELTYPRKMNMGGASVFEFKLNSSNTGRHLKITNFNHGGVAPVFYDLSNGKRYVGNISNPDTVRVLLDPSSVGYELVLTTQKDAYYKTITTLNQRNFTNYAQAANQGDYLIISNPLIYGSGSENYVEQYRQYRSSAVGGGFNAKLIDIEELVDQFAWGVKKHPLSIKNFLRYARSTFASAPKFAFLIGKGVTYNAYRANESNQLIERLNLVPTWGNPASDNMLASVDEKAIPATPIGRLSAVTPEEVGDYLNKVKQYEQAQKTTVHSLENKEWMKNVLQIAGANDIGLGNQLDGYLFNYQSIISDTAFGGSVTNFSKTADPAGYTDAIVSFKNIYEKGSSLITYFGHSSATSLDFNLDDPQSYDNQSKYPVFIANGCSAGNHFGFESSRFSTKTTISEKFVLAPNRGAIGYLASTHFGVVNYLDLFTRQFYRSIGKTKYNKPIGEIVQEGIKRALDTTGFFDYYARVHAETYAWHGDPAIKMNSFDLPDYAIEETQITVSPAFISVADTSFSVKVKVHNIGRAVKDSVKLKVTRTLPDGTETVIGTKTFAPINYADSFSVKVPVVGNRHLGDNLISATVNYTNDHQEVTFTNNTATKKVVVSKDEIRPVYPYNYAIINQAVMTVKASTVDALDTLREYIMEMDTTGLFNSPAKVTVVKSSVGGVIEFDPGITYQNGVTYFWRVSPNDLAQHNWRQFSFTYKAGSHEGFQQGHVHQNLNWNLDRLQMDSSNGKLSYQTKNHNLFITHSIYPHSGTEDLHFSIAVDGASIIRSACIGSSVIFNVFDPLTFLPMRNINNPFGAAAPCHTGREYNFEYSYRTASTRKNAMDFLDAIPNGSFVAVRLVLDQPYNVFAAQWAADTALYGSGNSLLHKLKKHGFAEIDSFYYARTWAFVFKKNDSSFTPVYELSEGLYDRVTLSVNATSPNIDGHITSPKFGPAKAWHRVKWNGTSDEVGNDIPEVEVIGIDNNNQELLLYKLNATQQDFDISHVTASLYPYIQLRMINTDSVTATPYQLKTWSLEYSPAPEVALAPNLYVNIPDTIGYTVTSSTSADTLHVGIAVKNVSTTSIDSIPVNLIMTDVNQNKHVFPVRKLKPLVAGDTLHFDVDLNVMNMQGRYNLYLQVNPEQAQTEHFDFNNFLYKTVYINRNKPLPVTLVDFNAVRNQAKVETHWSVTAETEMKQYQVEHSTNGRDFTWIGSVAASNIGSATKTYKLQHLKPVNGKNYYRLKMIGKDGNFTHSPVRIVSISNETEVVVYPNPTQKVLNLTVNTAGGGAAQLKIVNMYGQVMWQQKAVGSLHIDVTRWAVGTYVLHVEDGSMKKSYKFQKH